MAFEVSSLSGGALMTISFHRLYRNSSFLMTAIGVVFGFFLFARGYSGYVFDRQKIGLLCDMTLASGIFLVGIPLLASLILPERLLTSQRSTGLQYLTLGLQIIGFVLSIFFVLGFDNPGYVGFVQLPEQGVLVFLFALFCSVISALSFLSERLIRTQRSAISAAVFPVVLLYSACGVALSLLALQTVGAISSEADLYTATVPLNEFFRQIVVVSALATFAARLILDSSSAQRTFFTLVSAVSSAFLLVGFQASGLSQSANDWLFVLNQGGSAIGLCGFIWLSVVLMCREWKPRGREFIESGLWVSHSVFLLALFLTLILQMGVGRLILSFGSLDNLRLALLLFAAPLTFIRAVDHRPMYSHVTRSTVTALSWCGIFVVTLSILVIAPYGGSLSGIGHEAFKSFYGISMSGLFLLVMSYALILWDKILGEAI